MFRVSLMRAALLAVLASVVVFAAGCTSKVSGTLNPNQRPSVDLTSAPTQSTDRYFYAYRLDWSGYDPDGKVDYFLYAIDPPGPAAVAAGAETTWVKTTKNEQILFFKASRPDSGSVSRPTASDFHVFVIKAIDNATRFKVIGELVDQWKPARLVVGECLTFLPQEVRTPAP